MKSLIMPPYLREGDRIEIITPASHIEEEVVHKAVLMLEASGFRVPLGEHLFSRSGPFAGRDTPNGMRGTVTSPRFTCG